MLCLGALIAGFNDLYFDLLGYAVVLLNNCATAGYLVYTKQIKDELNAFGLIFYNAMISFPICVAACFMFDEFTYVQSFEYIDDTYFRVCFISAAFLAFTVNLTTAWCTQVNSALTTSVVGQTKNVF